MHRGAPLIVMLILSMAASAGALNAPSTDLSGGHACAVILTCFHSQAIRGPWPTPENDLMAYLLDNNVAVRVLGAADIDELETPNLQFVKTGFAGDYTESACSRTMVIELWDPFCAVPSYSGTEAYGTNIVRLTDADYKGVPQEYIFQEVEGGKSKGAYFRGAGFYAGFGKDPQGREKVLLAGNSWATLDEVIKEFERLVILGAPSYDSSVKYYLTDDWATTAVVSFLYDFDAASKISAGYETPGGKNQPMSVTDTNTKGNGDLAKTLLNVAAGGKLYFVGSAAEAFYMAKGLSNSDLAYIDETQAIEARPEGPLSAADKSNNIPYQMFAVLNERLEGKKFVPVSIKGCSRGKSMRAKGIPFEVPGPGEGDAAETGYLPDPAISEGGKYLIGKNGITCEVMESIERPRPVEASILSQLSDTVSECISEDSAILDNYLELGIYKEMNADAGGDITFISGLGKCSTYEMASSEDPKAVAEGYEPSELPAFGELTKTDLKCESTGERGMFENNGVLKCAGAEKSDLNLGETILEERKFGGGPAAPGKYQIGDIPIFYFRNDRQLTAEAIRALVAAAGLKYNPIENLGSQTDGLAVFAMVRLSKPDPQLTMQASLDGSPMELYKSYPAEGAYMFRFSDYASLLAAGAAEHTVTVTANLNGAKVAEKSQAFTVVAAGGPSPEAGGCPGCVEESGMTAEIQPCSGSIKQGSGKVSYPGAQDLMTTPHLVTDGPQVKVASASLGGSGDYKIQYYELTDPVNFKYAAPKQFSAIPTECFDVGNGGRLYIRQGGTGGPMLQVFIQHVESLGAGGAETPAGETPKTEEPAAEETKAPEVPESSAEREKALTSVNAANAKKGEADAAITAKSLDPLPDSVKTPYDAGEASLKGATEKSQALKVAKGDDPGWAEVTGKADEATDKFQAALEAANAAPAPAAPATKDAGTGAETEGETGEEAEPVQMRVYNPDITVTGSTAVISLKLTEK